MTTTETQQRQPTPTQDEETHARFYALYYKEGERLRRRINCLVRDPHVAEEVWQQTWIKVWKYLPTVKQQESYAWLYQTATNTAYDLWRHQGLRRDRQAFSFDQRPDTFTDEEAWQQWAELQVSRAANGQDDPETVAIVRENTREDAGLLADLWGDFDPAERLITLSRFAGVPSASLEAWLGMTAADIQEKRHNLLVLLRRRAVASTTSRRRYRRPGRKKKYNHEHE